jgi:hypothetical protein
MKCSLKLKFHLFISEYVFERRYKERRLQSVRYAWRFANGVKP